MKYLVICPIYNEAKFVSKFLLNMLNFINRDTHLLLLEDFSNDGTREILHYIQKNLSVYFKNKIFFVFNESNLGYGDNLLKGFEFGINREYDKILTIDCDFQHLPSYINCLISLSRKYKFVTGTRYSFNSYLVSYKNYYRYLVNKKMVELLEFLYKIKISDFFCGFRIYDKNLLISIYENLVFFKSEENINFSYDFPIYLWIEILNFTDSIKEFPIPYIFWTERNFKGSNTGNLKNHYERLKIYFSKFIKYYEFRKLGGKNNEILL